jgi:DNA primase
LTHLIRQVKDANNIVDVIGSYLPLRPMGATFKGLCPFHDDSRPSFDVDPNRERYRCWACGKYGDVISFIQEHDRVSFWEALELLARRAGISLEKFQNSQPNSGRAVMLGVVSWAQQQFHECLLTSPLAEMARKYVAGRGLSDETVRKYKLGYAPQEGDWLVDKGRKEGISFEVLEQVGLIAKRQEGKGYYDRFRDRVMFPIRNLQGKPVGFGGRILPDSPFSNRAPKYYNSCDTPLFSKSEFLYGLDQARSAAADVGWLAIVEGYTDVLMSHQMGVLPVAATMGTALNATHVRQIQRLVPQVVLVFDADDGGDTGVDRALEIFVSQNVQLRVATLPEGLDPCDLLLKEGAKSFQSVLTNAADVLEFKLTQVLTDERYQGLDGTRRAIDSVLTIIARGQKLTDQASQVKRELMVTRIAQRFGVREETIWARLKELRQEQENGSQKKTETISELAEVRKGPAEPHERELLQVLLAEPALVAEAFKKLAPAQIEHPGLRTLIEGLYRLLAEGVEPSLDQLRSRIDNAPLLQRALEMQDIGLANSDRRSWFYKIIVCFQDRQDEQWKRELQTKLTAAYESKDSQKVAELFKQLKNRTSG